MLNACTPPHTQKIPLQFFSVERGASPTVGTGRIQVGLSGRE